MTTSRNRARQIERAALALVAHWDDPFGGVGNGSFNAERWEIERDRREAALREALGLPTATTDGGQTDEA